MTLSLVGVSDMDEAGGLVAGQLAGRDARHLVERRDQAIDMAVDLGAFAERVDVGVVAAHAGVDDDAAVDGDAGLLGQRRVRPDADRHDDERRRNDRAVGELHLLDLAVAR